MDNFKVNIRSINDGKDKRQSEELHIQVDLYDCETDTYGDLSIVTYGANKTEVGANFSKFISKFLADISKLKI